MILGIFFQAKFRINKLNRGRPKLPNPILESIAFSNILRSLGANNLSTIDYNVTHRVQPFSDNIFIVLAAGNEKEEYIHVRISKSNKALAGIL